MSIIQEALKKAQKPDRPERAEPAKQNAPQEKMPQPAAARRPLSFRANALYITALAVVVCVYIITQAYRPARQTEIVRARKSAEIPIIAEQKAAENEPAQKPAENTISWDQNPDIMEPVKTIFGGNDGLTLSGIMRLEDGPRAIINDAMVGEGDTVNGATILSISERQVILRKLNSQIVLNLK